MQTTPLMRSLGVPLALLAVVAASGCVADGAVERSSAAPIEDDGPDDLYRDFLDGKFDGAGHPVGATVLSGAEGCAPETGEAGKGGEWILAPGAHAAGVACSGSTRRLGRGVYHASLRAAAETLPGCDGDCEPSVAFEVRVLDDTGTVLATQSFDEKRFESALEWENLAVRFQVRSAGEVRVEVRWPGELPLRLKYVEVFRQDRQLVLSPPSGVLDDGARFRIEIVDPPDEALPRVRCNDEDVTERLAELLASGEATEENTDFRRILTAPAGALFDGCGPTRDVVVEIGEPYVKATSEARYLDAAPPCEFSPGGVRVLITGFVPFPAGSRSINSSALAVTSFDPETVPDAAVMWLTLPVEFDAAAAIVADVIERCAPEVVVGFGQGRWDVDLETTAYNRRDTSEVSGGVPDNRGVIFDGTPIVDGAPAELSTRLPVDAIEARLVEAGIDGGPNDDPGRYVCNDLFFSIMTATDADTTAGFVHLPRIFSPTDEDVRMLQTVVGEVVSEAIASRRPSGA